MITIESGSFRDRDAQVATIDSRILRLLSDRGADDWSRVSNTVFFSELVANGSVIGTRELTHAERANLNLPSNYTMVLEHDRIPFVSYPYEWSFEMLRQAALLHLEILSKAISSGFILKDASPYNVQFIGARPVFIDMGSFTSLAPGEPWIAYRQFCEMMLFPLLLQAYRGVDLQPVLRSDLEGISARRFLQWLSYRDMLRGGVFTHGWLQSLLEQQTKRVTTSTVADLQQSGFGVELIRNNIRKLTRLVSTLKWSPPQTQWSNYRMDQEHVLQDGLAKSEFVKTVSNQFRRQLVWDLGCNDGEFSLIVAENAETVIAIDGDHGCVERFYSKLNSQAGRNPTEATMPSNILPLCINLSNPSPGLGWRGKERKRLEERGRPDLVLCLGLIHHLVIACNIPLAEVVAWLTEIGGEVVIEFPSKRDAMVQSLLRNKRDQYSDYSLDELERLLANGFQIRSKIILPSGERTLLHVTPQK